MKKRPDVDIGDSFKFRSRCNKCGGFPNINYTYFNASEDCLINKSVIKNKKLVSSYIRRLRWNIASAHRIALVPKNDYNPRLHKNTKTNFDQDYIENNIIYCQCYQTSWAFKITENKKYSKLKHGYKESK